MKIKSPPIIGIIAEDPSDVSTLKILIRKISKNDRVAEKHFTGGGCGAIKSKCRSWAKLLLKRGCKILVLVHDLDKKGATHLRESLEQAIRPCAISTYLICIPVEEIEAWLLSDPEAIKKGMKLRTAPKTVHHPEKIVSPKEEIERIVGRISNYEVMYVNTVHNDKIASHISVEKIRLRCPSFVPFHDFVCDNIRG